MFVGEVGLTSSDTLNRRLVSLGKHTMPYMWQIHANSVCRFCMAISKALPRYSNSKKLIDDIRNLFAENVDSDVWKKAKLKTLLAELDGIDEEAWDG